MGCRTGHMCIHVIIMNVWLATMVLIPFSLLVDVEVDDDANHVATDTGRQNILADKLRAWLYVSV